MEKTKKEELLEELVEIQRKRLERYEEQENTLVSKSRIQTMNVYESDKDGYMENFRKPFIQRNHLVGLDYEDLVRSLADGTYHIKRKKALKERNEI